MRQGTDEHRRHRALYPVAALAAAALALPSGASAAVALGEADAYAANVGGSFQNAFALGDLDGDGRPEAVVGSRPQFDTEQAFFSVLANDGSGAFGAPVKHGVGSGEAVDGVAVAHVFGEPDRDVVATTRNGGPAVFQGGGNLGFLTATGRDPQGQGGAPLVAKLDGDRYPDLAIANGGPATVAVFRGGPGGSIEEEPRTFDTGVNAGSLAAADVNRDGRQDVIVAGLHGSGGSGSTISLLLGKRGGRFAAPSLKAWGTGFPSVAAGDVAGDRRLEVVANAPGDGFVSIWSVTRAGALGGRTKLPMPAGVNGSALADLDGDRRLDVVGALADERISVRTGRSGGGFRAARNFPAGGPVSVLRVADLDGDRDRDVVSLAGDWVRVLLNG